jgi:hypothetical protein
MNARCRFNKKKYRDIGCRFTIKMEEVQFCRLLTIDEVEAYCMLPNADARQNIICDAIRSSLCVYPFGCGVYFFEIGPNVFKRVGGNGNDSLKSLLQ